MTTPGRIVFFRFQVLSFGDEKVNTLRRIIQRRAEPAGRAGEDEDVGVEYERFTWYSASYRGWFDGSPCTLA